MKTLALLSLLALLAFQAQADPLPEAGEETKTDEQPGAEDQELSISFGDPEGSALQDGASRKIPLCTCRKACRFHERAYAICLGKKLLCCR